MTLLGDSEVSAITIDRSLSETLYSQLCRQLRELILNGSLSAGTRLPPTRTLSAEASISRITVRESYEQLTAEGYLRSVTGKGTFVTDHPRLLEAVSVRRNDVSSQSNKIRSAPISSRAKNILSIPFSPMAPQHLPFNPALPDLNLIPFFKWNRIVKNTLHYHHDAMDYSNASGFLPLREVLANSLYLTRGVNCDPDQVIIAASSEQAIKRIVFLLLDQSDCVWFGEPGMHSRRHAFRTAGVNTLTVPIDNEGVRVDQAYKYGKKAKLAYVFPWLHYPLNITMSLSRRLELLKWASSNNGWILEDGFSSEINYVGRVPPSIQSLDIEQRVLYMGSFSMTLFPALRLSYIVVPKSLVGAAKKISRLEQSVSTVLQPALAQFIAEGHYIAHIRKMRKVYHRRQKFLTSFLEHKLSDMVSISGASGGLNIMLNLPHQISDRKISELLSQSNIIAHPIVDYYLTKPTIDDRRNALVLGFACSSRRQLEQSAEILVAKVLAEFKVA